MTKKKKKYRKSNPNKPKIKQFTENEWVCASPWFIPGKNGYCPDCGRPTVNGEAQEGCEYSPTSCETCGYAECDGSC